MTHFQSDIQIYNYNLTRIFLQVFLSLRVLNRGDILIFMENCIILLMMAIICLRYRLMNVRSIKQLAGWE